MSLKELQKKLVKRFPNAILDLDESPQGQGGDFLDVRLKDHCVVVEWRKDKGFGISSRSDIGYGEGVDEIYPSADEAYQRIVALFLSGSRTSSPREIRLRELRESTGLSQVELAKRMSIQQTSVSKIEQGRDLHMSTLASFVSALGGEISVTVRFPEGIERHLDVQQLMGRGQVD
jgi:DNA-binding XRE family transcriptional regulator